MSSGVLVGMNEAIRLARGTTRLPIISTGNLRDITVVNNNSFQLSTGGHSIFFSIQASGAESAISFSIELYNEALCYVVQSFDAVAPANGSPLTIPCMFMLTVSDPLHAYSFRITATTGGMPDYVMDLRAPAFYCVISETSGSGGNSGDTVVYDSVSEGVRVNKLIDLKRIGPLDEPASVQLTGTGETSFSLSSTATALSVGALTKEPGRVYVEGRLLKNNGNTQYMNGVNTPWHEWNEFGAVTGGTYNHAWWDAEFQRLVSRGINSLRFWVICNAQNEGVVIDADGRCAAPTDLFWQNVDDLMALASQYEIFVMPTMFSFDCFSWNTAGSQKWHRMLGEEAGVQSLLDNYIIPFVNRYKDNKWVWAIDLCNEMEWLKEQSDLATPYGVTCTPVGMGSAVVNFSQRVPDFVVGQQLFCINSSGVSYDMGLVVTRNSDTQVTCTNSFLTASETLVPGSSAGCWMFTGFTWRTIRRYLAMASAAIHSSLSKALVSFGSGTVKYSSANYDGDNFSDALLANETGNGLSKLDFHQVHWYSWAEPWYRLMLSPVSHGLSAKPAVMGELPARWEELNCPSVMGWSPNRWYNENAIVCKNVNNDINFYKNVKPGGGNSGLDIGPVGSDPYNDETDGACTWRYMTHGSWQGNKVYSVYDMVIADIGGWDPDYPPDNGFTATPGRVYICTTGGTSDQNGSGPTGEGETISDGTVIWQYVRDIIVDKQIGDTRYTENMLYAFFAANGWCGHMIWSSNAVDANNGLYETHINGQFIQPWAALTDYYVNNEVLNDGDKLYRCITQGKSAGSGGPTGTGADITDGQAHWAYVKTLSTPWTSAGVGIKEFSDNNAGLIYPDTSGAWDNSGAAIRQSKERAWYATGSDIRSSLSFVLGSSEANLVQRVGVFDAYDGLFLSVSGADALMNFVIRSSGEEISYPRASWSDPLDGTGPSGVSLDLSAPQLLIIDSGWMHGGKTRFGFAVGGLIMWAHEFTFGNVLSPVYPSNPSLPLRWEISSSGPLDQTRTLYVFHGQAYASVEASGSPAGCGRNMSAVGVGGGDMAEAIALRVTSALTRFATFRLKRITLVNTSGIEQYYFSWKIVLNPQLNAVGSFSLLNGVVEGATNRTVVQNTGKVLAQGFNRGDCEIPFYSLPFLGVDAQNVADILSIQIYNMPNNMHWFYVGVEWEEVK